MEAHARKDTFPTPVKMQDRRLDGRLLRVVEPTELIGSKEFRNLLLLEECYIAKETTRPAPSGCQLLNTQGKPQDRS